MCSKLSLQQQLACRALRRQQSVFSQHSMVCAEGDVRSMLVVCDVGPVLGTPAAGADIAATCTLLTGASSGCWRQQRQHCKAFLQDGMHGNGSSAFYQLIEMAWCEQRQVHCENRDCVTGKVMLSPYIIIVNTCPFAEWAHLYLQHQLQIAAAPMELCHTSG